jgi:hypothetical protein
MAVNNSQGFRSMRRNHVVMAGVLEGDTALLPDIAIKRGPGR